MKAPSCNKLITLLSGFVLFAGLVSCGKEEANPDVIGTFLITYSKSSY